jgi:filamentous hemagglutinin family protein
MRPRHHSYDYRPTALALALAAAFPIASWANPVDPTVSAGQATFHQSGPALTVTNAPGTIIDWRSFSIGQGELTRFVQQSAASQVLNRVTGGDPSQILGSLQSNGQVFLINPNGIAFGPDARVDVAGLVASTLGMTNADFLAGRLNFSADLEPGSVRNEGQLRSIGGGSIYLIAPTVENHGVIQAADGAVVLAAGRTATLVDSNRPDVRVEITAPGDSVLNVGQIVGGHIGIYAGAIRNEGTVSATTAMVGADGTVVFRASTSVITGNRSVTEANGRLGGDIAIEADTASIGGTIRAGGATGGHVAIDADIVTQYGTVSADGATGAGGRVEIAGTNGVLQTVDALTSARGTDGGSITVRSGGAGLTFISGRVDANATSGHGGEIRILGGDIALAGATIAANGPLGGGTILVGGDTQGANPAIANARTVYAGVGTQIGASALVNGDGGKIVLWSDDTTRVGATLTARGGATSGDGGSIEVSGKEHTTFGGTASAAAPNGESGTFLLDPKNIYIDTAVGTINFRDLLDPHPNTDGSGGNGWGSVIEVRGGNTLVTDPYDNAMGTRSGAIYVYRGSDGALLTALTGAAAQDQVGIGQRIDASSKLLLVHSLFGSGDGVQANARGALTWLDPATGKLSDGTSSGVVSTSNSLVGTHAGDRLSFTADNQFVYPFQGTGSKYFVISQAWNGERGAITWIDTATGRLADGSTGGAVGTANSLVGANAGDRVGSLRAVYTYNPLTGFYQTIYQPTYQKVGESSGILFFDGYFGGAGVIANAKGAVSWMNMGTGRLSDGTTGGVVSTANSLIGAAAGDHIGASLDGSALLSTSGYDALILSPAFGGGKGAFTWISGSTGKLVDGSTGGIVGTANSFTGSNAGDAVGGGTINKVSTSRYMVLNPNWGTQAGAITWIDMTTGKTVNGVSAGAIGAANSLVGGTPGDNIAGNVTRLDSGHYLALAPDVDVPGDGEFGVSGRRRDHVDDERRPAGERQLRRRRDLPATSLVGTVANSRIGSGGYVSSGDSTTRSLLVLSPFWGGTGGSGPRGAVTWLNGFTGNTLAGTSSGALDATNSLVGALAGDRIGALDVAGLSGVQRVGSSNRNFTVASPFWNDSRGAVTWISAAGLTAAGSNAVGTVATTNSVYGMTAGDRVGEVVQRLSNGNVVIVSSQWDNAGIDGDGTDAGAVTWLSGIPACSPA